MFVLSILCISQFGLKPEKSIVYGSLTSTQKSIIIFNSLHFFPFLEIYEFELIIANSIHAWNSFSIPGMVMVTFAN